jgi:uncharacterized protein (DUF58 family)
VIDLARLDRIARRARLGRGARGLGIIPGRRLAPQRGYGLSLAGHREYGFGDDVRHVDWRVTARLGRPFLKLFQQERSGTVLVLADASASMRGAEADAAASGATAGGTDRAIEAAALVVLMAAHAQERVGVALFTDRIEWLRRPRRGRMPALAAIRAMERFRPSSRQTSVTTALAQAGRLLRSAATIVIISDFIDRGYESAVAALRHRHEVLALCLTRSHVMPEAHANAGLVRARDPESGRVRWLDTRDARVRAVLHDAQRLRTDRRRAIFDTLSVPHYELSADAASEGAWLRVGARL